MKSVFVSSTFRDMHFERDILNRRVAPKLNHQLANYNQSVRILDLRWGVDTSDMTEHDAASRVLSTCFHAIDECRPYMIVLIGDRYGYVPDGSNISVTHMEIIRGIFESTDREHVYVYFRVSDYAGMPDDVKSTYIEQDEAAREVLVALKRELLSKYPDCCRQYKAHWSNDAQCLVSDEFERMIVEDLEADLVLANRSVRYRSQLHKQIRENEEILADRVRYAYSNMDKIHSDVEAIIKSDLPYGIIGDGGTGKSIYMSLLCSALRDEGKKTYILFCGDNSFSASVRSTAEMVLYVLCEALGEAYSYEENAVLSYDALIALIVEKRSAVKERCYLLLDAIDKCDVGMVNFIYWCNRFLSNQVKVVFSSRMIAELDAQKGSFLIAEMQYDRHDFGEMIRCLLHRHGKTITQGHIDMLLERVKTPLQLNLMMIRLLNLRSADFEAIQKMGGDIDAINLYLSRVIEESPVETDELIVAYLKMLIADNKNPNFALNLLNILAYCEYGLLEDDMRAIFDLISFKWIELDYLEFREQFSFFVRVRENGRLDFSHDIVKRTIRAVFADKKKETCSVIAMYWLYCEKQDAVAIRSFLDVVYEGGQYKRFIEFIQKHKSAFLTIDDPAKAPLAEEIRNGINRLFLKDKGDFIFKAVTKCSSVEEIAYFQMVLSTSLLSINDYHSKEIIFKIAFAVMLIPSRVHALDDQLFELELEACERFLRRHNATKNEIEEFIAYYKRPAQEKERPRNREKTDGTLTDELLASLHQVGEEDRADKSLLWAKVAASARAMSSDKKTARNAERIALELVAILDEGVLMDDEMMRDVSYADVYTTLGSAYKALEAWEKGIYYDQLSLEIYKKLYEKSLSPDIFKKYRERVYNVANMTEAWAMHAKNNTELWHKTVICYENAYAMELIAISHGIAERDILHSASSILSLGTALINAGRFDEGMEKYREGIALMQNSAQSHRNVDLYTQLSVHLLECIYQLVVCEKIEAAYTLSEHIGTYLSYVIESDLNGLSDRINEICTAFSNRLNDIIRQLHDCEDLEGQILVSRILCRMYTAILPVAPHAVKANIIITKCNIGAIFFWQKKDYALAYDEYQELLHFVVEHDLACADENGKYVDQANARLADAYIRSALCLERMGREAEVKAFVGDATQWAAYIADHMDAYKGDTPRVLFEMSVSLARNKSPLGLLFLMKAFNAMSEETYDKKAHAETAMMIVQALSAFGQGENT